MASIKKRIHELELIMASVNYWSHYNDEQKERTKKKFRNMIADLRRRTFTVIKGENDESRKD